MAGVVTVLPVAASFDRWPANSGPQLTAIRDSSDALFLDYTPPQGFVWSSARCWFEVPDVPAGAKLTSARVIARARSVTNASWHVLVDMTTTIQVPSNTVGDYATGWQQLVGNRTTPRQLQFQLRTSQTSVNRRLYRMTAEVEYDERPTAAITSPSPTVTSSQPRVAWTYADDLHIQESWQVRILDADGDEVAGSGRVYSSFARTWRPQPLPNGDYTVEVVVWQEFQVDHPSLPAVQSFTVDAPVPNPPRMAVTPDVKLAEVQLELTPLPPHTLVNPGFEDGIDGWHVVSNGGSPGWVVETFASPRSGNRNLAFRAGASGPATTAALAAGGPPDTPNGKLAVIQGDEVSFAGWMAADESAPGGAAPRYVLSWRATDGTEVDRTEQPLSGTIFDDEYVYGMVTGNAPAGATYVVALIEHPPGTPASEDYLFDDMEFGWGTSPGFLGTEVDIERATIGGDWIRITTAAPFDGPATIVDRWVPLGVQARYRTRSTRHDGELTYTGDWSGPVTVTVPHRMDRIVSDIYDLDLLIEGWPDSRLLPSEVHRPLDTDRPIIDTGIPQGRDGQVSASVHSDDEMAALDAVYMHGQPVLVKLEQGETRWLKILTLERDRIVGNRAWYVTLDTVEVATPDGQPAADAPFVDNWGGPF